MVSDEMTGMSDDYFATQTRTTSKMINTHVEEVNLEGYDTSAMTSPLPSPLHQVQGRNLTDRCRGYETWSIDDISIGEVAR